MNIFEFHTLQELLLLYLLLPLRLWSLNQEQALEPFHHGQIFLNVNRCIGEQYTDGNFWKLFDTTAITQYREEASFYYFKSRIECAYCTDVCQL